MASVRSNLLPSLGQRCRLVAAALTSRFWPGRGTAEVLQILQGCTGRQQALWIGAVLGLLFGLALFAAQFGAPGLVVYFAVIVFLIR